MFGNKLLIEFMFKKSILLYCFWKIKVVVLDYLNFDLNIL